MEYRFKIYLKNGAAYFTPCPKDTAIQALEDALRLVNENGFEKIDLYIDTKLSATIYG